MEKSPRPPSSERAKPSTEAAEDAEQKLDRGRRDEIESRLAELEAAPEWSSRAGRRTFREKFAAGLNGLKHAFRGDSSFCAHPYRGLLIALAATLLQVDAIGWCLLALSAALVFIAELAHSAVVTLARVIGDPEEPRLTIAREIATGGVFVAVTTMGAVSLTVLGLQLVKQLGR
jgi:diacylglycerol kinase (ATP)